MNIGIYLYGIIYGKYKNSDGLFLEKDFSHCWPNIKRMLVEPLINQGHSTDIFLSTYLSNNIEKHNEILKEVSPKAIIYSDINNSNPSTCKLQAFKLMKEQNNDIIILCRSDMHFSKVIPNENIQYNKFNFLFPETGGIWWDIMRFTTDNFYIWPHYFTNLVEDAMNACLRFRLEKHDTHALYPQLALKINNSDIHFISNIAQGSDVNSYYTVCRKELPNNQYIHPEVKERFGYVV